MLRDVRDARAAYTRSLLAAIVESTDDAVIAKTTSGVITQWNRGAERLYGFAPSEAVGRRIDLIVPSELAGEEDMILDRVAAGRRVEDFETVRVCKDGARVDVSLTVSPIVDETGRIVGASSISRNIGGRKRLEAELQFLADHDPLTELFNRRRFEQELERELAVARRHGRRGRC